MSDNKACVLLGYSGHGYVVAEAAVLAGMNLRYYAEKTTLALNPYGLEYVGFEQDIDFMPWAHDFDFILGIGSNTIRTKVAQSVIAKDKKLLNVIHPDAKVSQSATIGQGNLIARGALLNPLANIGSYCIINTGAIIEHEAAVADGAHIAPSAVLAGNVHVGTGTFVGANSVVKQGVKIGANVTVGAGSVVLKDIPNSEVWAGNPARKIK